MKNLLLPLLFSLFYISAFSQTSFTDDNGNKFTGLFVKNNFTGQGICTYADGSKYSGIWKDAQYQGLGTINWKNGDSYTGNWKNGQRSGTGTLKLANKEKYTGGWLNDKMNGKGTWYNANGTIYYTGEWKDGLMDGTGKLAATNSETFEGTFENGKKSVGVLKVKIGLNTITYKGDFKNNEVYKGKITYPDGSYYEGAINNRMPDFHGQLNWVKNGKVIQRYEGNWKDGEKDGDGSFNIYENGQLQLSYKGIWNKGELIVGELFIKGQVAYTGKFSSREQIEKGLNGEIKSMFDLGSFCLERGDTQNGLKWLEKCNAKNYGPAIYLLSTIYMEGKYVSKDEAAAKQYLDKSLPLLEEAANKNDENAMMLLGYYKVSAGDNTGITLLEKAVALKNTDAMLALGAFYQLGKGVAKDMNKAMQLYKNAADANIAYAMYVTGYLLYAGVEVTKNETEGLKWLNKAADAGYGEAFYTLGTLYQKEKKGYEYFEKGAALGHPGCMVEASGSEYIKQGWVSKVHALQLLESAAFYNNIDALIKLGDFYKNGNDFYSVSQNCEKALSYFEKAANKGDVLAMNTIDVILVNPYSSCNGKISYAYKKMLTLIDNWTKMGYLNASNQLAYYYLNGQCGLVKDEKRGFELLLNNAEKGCISNEIILCYRFGSGCKKNKKMEAYWQQKYDEQERKKKQNN